MDWQPFAIFGTLLLGIWNLVYNYRNSKRTTFINTVTSERLKWIHETRDAISTLCGRTYYWVMTQDQISPEESNNVRKEIDKLKLLVKLYLNPKSNKDINIMKLIDKIPEYTDRHRAEEMKKLLKNIVSKSQFLLKDEWDKARDESVSGDLRLKKKFFRI
jgi:hypothetical protein